MATPGNLGAVTSLLCQNLIKLCKDLKLPVVYKAVEVLTDDGGCDDTTTRDRVFYIVVHVLGDHAFKKYLQHCSNSDLLLFRGLLLKAVASPALDQVCAVSVQQAFLPKFENEGQDASIAAAIVAGAEQRFMVVTIKHSGSLVTLSAGQGFAAKNSLDNEFTAGAAVLLHAHYKRRCRGDQAAAEKQLAALMAVLAARSMSLSFEMVTGCHGHHGQLPAGEYLVTTSAHALDPLTGRPVFLPWHQFLDFCLEQGLPLNDTWLLAGSSWAQACRETLDQLALSGGPTGRALQQLQQLVTEGASTGCLHLPGTYPHDQWQGSRIEGFVVSQGQTIGPDTQQALAALCSPMSAAVLPLDSVPEPLRQPYKELLAAARGSGAEVVATVHQQHAGWLPHPRLQQTSTQQREMLVQAILSRDYLSGAGDSGAGSVGDGADGHVKGVRLTLPSGELLLSRCKLAALSGEEACGVLAGEVPGGGAQGVEVEEVRRQLRAAADDAALQAVKVRVVRALCGSPDVGHTLRYKKKMLLWSLPPLSAGAPAGPGVQGEVGYCMMTFVIRNGLQALGLGLPTYLAYVGSLARSWGLTAAQAAQLDMFARSWASWIAARGGVASVSSSTFLDQAEPFARAFIAAGGCLSSGVTAGAASRPEGAFQGVLVLVDTPEALLPPLREALQVQHVLDAAKLPAFSKPLVVQGSLLWLAPGAPPPKQLRQFAEAAAAHLYVVVQRPEGVDEESPAAKKQRGMQLGKIKPLEAALAVAARAQGLTSPQARLLNLAEVDVGAAVSEVKAWAGAGAPLPHMDPCCVACFLSIPGSGKTVLAGGLDGSTLDVGGAEGRVLSVKVLNSDTLKATARGFQANRYWNEVAAAAESYQGGRNVTLVVADKNLVPSPQGNVQRAVNILRESGASTMAVLPYCRCPTTQDLRPDLYQGLPELPMPLEMVALCMLRVLWRKSHEGGLDAALPVASSVVAMFANFFRNTSYTQLLERARHQFHHVVQLPIMRGAAVGAAAAPAPAATTSASAAAAADVTAHTSDQAQAATATLPEELLRHLAAGLARVSETRKPPLPEEWEERARELLLAPETAAALLSLQEPLDVLRGQLKEALTSGLSSALDNSAQGSSRAAGGGDAAAGGTNGLAPAPSISEEVRRKLVTGPEAGAGAGAGQQGPCAPMEVDVPEGGAPAAAPQPVRWIAIAGLDAAPLQAALQQLLPDLPGRVKSELHVTLWHVDDPVLGPNTQLRDQLMSAIGSQAVVEVTALDKSPEVTAAVVEIRSAPDAALVKEYPHITLVVGPGATAKDANQLPARLREGTAERLPLREPLTLIGQVLGFVEG